MIYEKLYVIGKSCFKLRNHDFFRQRATGTRAKGPAGVAVNRQDRPLSDSNQQQQAAGSRIENWREAEKTENEKTCNVYNVATGGCHLRHLRIVCVVFYMFNVPTLYTRSSGRQFKFTRRCWSMVTPVDCHEVSIVP